MIEAWAMVIVLAFVVLFAMFPWWAVVVGVYAVSIPANAAIWAVER